MKGIVSAIVVSLLISTPAHAQQRFALEVRGGLAIPTQEVQDEPLGTDVAFEGTVRYRVLDHLAAYAGWAWTHFGPESSFAGSDVDFEETGYAFGLRWAHPFRGEGGPGYWVRGGATYDHLELEDTDGETLADSGHGFGWEAGAGLAFPVGGSLALTPGLRFRSLSREVQATGTPAAVDVALRYLVVDVGLAFAF